ncbi:hypothetical protein RRG08_044261 [Elysia crispata]|uniref:Uncharacterized protein n=1 Tax=Elysia crispata TaxID=231223 RepID=A0AAE0XWN8_9GAST|nr:hypothetical protein RRG08_044261 [Elysia crispata]
MSSITTCLLLTEFVFRVDFYGQLTTGQALPHIICSPIISGESTFIDNMTCILDNIRTINFQDDIFHMIGKPCPLVAVSKCNSLDLTAQQYEHINSIPLPPPTLYATWSISSEICRQDQRQTPLDLTVQFLSPPPTLYATWSISSEICRQDQRQTPLDLTVRFLSPHLPSTLPGL